MVRSCATGGGKTSPYSAGDTHSNVPLHHTSICNVVHAIPARGQTCRTKASFSYVEITHLTFLYMLLITTIFVIFNKKCFRILKYVVLVRFLAYIDIQYDKTVKTVAESGYKIAHQFICGKARRKETTRKTKP
jgi:predicted ATPase